MQNKRILKLALGLVVVVGSCFILCNSMNPIFEYLCNQDTDFAQLDAGNNRVISISAESCWEVGRGLYYEVKDKGMIVSSKSLFGTDDGDDRHNYSLVYAENNSLVGVLETSSTSPYLVIIYDFLTNESWPESVYSEGSTYWETGTIKWREIFQRLQKENPQLVTPSIFEG